jgi:hypothetical protein
MLAPISLRLRSSEGMLLFIIAILFQPGSEVISLLKYVILIMSSSIGCLSLMENFVVIRYNLLLIILFSTSYAA